MKRALMDLFPPIEPYAWGALEVGDGHTLYWEESGNPQGPPVLFVHGGPGAGTAPPYRRFFDPAHWRIILFDQRGSGRSVPYAETRFNTTGHLISDMEKLRRHLAVDRWLLFGGSWGSTLALAYGQAHPERVTGFVLRGVFLFRESETEWFLHGMAAFYPEAHRRFVAHVQGDGDDVLAAYHRRLTHPDPNIHLPAARMWSGYEESCARLVARPDPVEPDGAAALAMARMECHYMVHGGFLRPGQLLEEVGRIAHLPARIVQGRYDIICPPVSAFDLAQAWPKARLTMVAEAGHSAMEPGLRTALVAAVEELRRICS
ncbi:prolyl aminopeptidase [Magnetospirillum moscoviense]|uniref:Proline iminopeptidase n=2 Tax=Magnetospirillum moscoviense TaxID=1437059 RepID=A0A178ML89_9PROT|nr:prolyl aminopeptidase [Magnetospirillum moscoviense]